MNDMATKKIEELTDVETMPAVADSLPDESALPEIPAEAPPEKDAPETPKPESDAMSAARRSFLSLDLREFDRDLSARQRQEWENIYISFRSQSPLKGIVSGAETIGFSVYNEKTRQSETRQVLCLTVIDYRVKVLIPETELWADGRTLERQITSHMLGAQIEYIVTNIDRQGECAVASRRLAMERKRRSMQYARSGNKPGDRVLCRVLLVGPKRMTVECGGYDLVLRPKDISYTSILDLRDEPQYRPGTELEAVIKEYRPEDEVLEISVKEVNPNPFIGADRRHPVGCDRQAVVTSMYKGGVFCRFSDDVTCMCLFSRSYSRYDCSPGDRVIVRITRYDYDRQRIYGRIIARW